MAGEFHTPGNKGDSGSQGVNDLKLRNGQWERCVARSKTYNTAGAKLLEILRSSKPRAAAWLMRFSSSSAWISFRMVASPPFRRLPLWEGYHAAPWTQFLRHHSDDPANAFSINSDDLMQMRNYRKIQHPNLFNLFQQ